MEIWTVLTFCVGVVAECIAEIFELAVKDDPTNEEYLTQLFMAYVRMNEYKKQQHVSDIWCVRMVVCV